MTNKKKGKKCKNKIHKETDIFLIDNVYIESIASNTDCNINMFPLNHDTDKSNNFILEQNFHDTTINKLTNYKKQEIQNNFINKPLNQWGEWIYS